MGRAREIVVELLTASVLGSIFEIVFAWAIGAEPSLGYLALTAGLNVTAALAVATCFAFWPTGAASSLSLAAWTGLTGWAQGELLPALGLAVLVGGLLEFTNLSRRGPLERGLSVAAALSIGLVVGTRLIERSPLLSASDFISASGGPAIGFVLLIAVALWPRLEGMTPYPTLTPPAGLGVLGAMGLVAVSPLLISEGAPWRQRVPAYADHTTTPTTTPSRPGIIVVILDTVRADHLSIYGYERETTPELAAFLARNPEAVVHPFAHSNSTWTLPAHASLFTGLLASDHRVHAQTVMTATGIQEATLAADSTMAEVLKQNGYRTGGVFGNTWLRNVAGLDRGFDWYRHPLASIAPSLGERIRKRFFEGLYRKEGAGLVTAAALNRNVLRFLDACEPGPCFVVANYIEAHAPYLPAAPFEGSFRPASAEDWSSPGPEDSDETLEIRMARYDEEILELDHGLGRLLEELERRGTLDRSWLVITSDHGEAFGEHGRFEHGAALYGEVTRIPLIVKPPPGHRNIQSDSAVGLIDLTATLTQIGTGRSLGDGHDLRGVEVSPVAIELFPNALKRALHGPSHGFAERGVIQGTLKLIERSDGEIEIYDLQSDPLEERELSVGDSSPSESTLMGLLPPLEASEISGRMAVLSRDDAAQLKALGYLPPDPLSQGGAL